jgi:hypothetical protein
MVALPLWCGISGGAWDLWQTRALKEWVVVGFWWLGYVALWGEICGWGGTA